MIAVNVKTSLKLDATAYVGKKVLIEVRTLLFAGIRGGAEMEIVELKSEKNIKLYKL